MDTGAPGSKVKMMFANQFGVFYLCAAVSLWLNSLWPLSDAAHSNSSVWLA